MSESTLATCITIKQDGVDSFASALWNPQHYEIFIDDRRVGELNGYQNHLNCSIAPGPHSIYVRAYARDSASPTRVYGYSEPLEVDVSPGEDKTLACGLVKGPRARKVLILTSASITVLLYACVAFAANLSPRTRYLPVLIMAVITMACSWYGYSSKPGSSVYLKES